MAHGGHDLDSRRAPPATPFGVTQDDEHAGERALVIALVATGEVDLDLAVAGAAHPHLVLRDTGHAAEAGGRVPAAVDERLAVSPARIEQILAPLPEHLVAAKPGEHLGGGIQLDHATIRVELEH